MNVLYILGFVLGTDVMGSKIRYMVCEVYDLVEEIGNNEWIINKCKIIIVINFIKEKERWYCESL